MIDYRSNFSRTVFYIIFLVVAALRMAACAPVATPGGDISVQAALPTPTLEPTFTPSPLPADTPIPTPTDTPSPEPTPVPRASLSGRILDQSTNQPIANAQVSAGVASTTTDPDGRYSLTNLPPGQYVLSVTHPDYDPGLSSIVTVAAGEEPVVDVRLYERDTSPYPQDPMLTNPLDPNGAPTEADAERLAREQGLTAKVVSIEETTLSGEYLVNYKIGDDIRAAVAEINHEVWELTDETGRKWWIIKVCGNLASPLPEQMPIATPAPVPLPPMAEVVIDGLIVRTCTSDECAEVGTVSSGERVKVFGCLADRSWCEVSWSGGRGWCIGQSLRQLAVAEAVPVVKVVLPTSPPRIDQADLAVIDLFPEYGPQPQILEGSPIGTVYIRIENKGPDALTNVGVDLSCTSNAFGQTWSDSSSLTKKGVRQLSMAPGQSEELNTGIFVHGARGSWFEVICSIAFDNDPNLSNNTFTKRLP